MKFLLSDNFWKWYAGLNGIVAVIGLLLIHIDPGTAAFLIGFGGVGFIAGGAMVIRDV